MKKAVRAPSAQNGSTTQSRKELHEPKKRVKLIKSNSGTYSKAGTNDLSIENELLRAKLKKAQLDRDVALSQLQDVEMLLKRLDESEAIRKQQQETIQNQEAMLRAQSEQFARQLTTLTKECDSIKDENKKMLRQKQGLQKEVAEAAKYIDTMESRVYEANKTSLDLLSTLKDAETEVETLKAYVIDLKGRIAVYVPVKGDPIDKKLADYINNYPDRQKLKIMFMRESEGVYEFGSKRIAVKIERGKIQIIVGGGFLAIDEFLDQYTPVELEKLERKDPLKKFSEKVSVQKTLERHYTSQSSLLSPLSPTARSSISKKK